jgi:uncharacterized protein (TIGR03118 family)
MRSHFVKIWDYVRSGSGAGHRSRKTRRSSRPAFEVLEDRCTPTTTFLQTNVVSDVSGLGQFTDAHLKNPWGLAYSPTGPFWVSDNNVGVSTIYTGQGQLQTPIVTIPLPAGGSGTARPDGIVFNSDPTAFMVTSGAQTASTQFIFATEDGTISGWNPGVDQTHAILKIDKSANPSAGNGAVYKGLAIGTDSTGRLLLYAANFRAGAIDVFDRNFQATTVSGGFQDANLPTGFAPFNIQNINGQFYVAYAKQDAARANNVAGAGAGFVDVFTSDGRLVRRLASGGPLNSPWGLTIAPASYGDFGGDLLVGNFGDGHINVYNPTSGTFLGQFKDSAGNLITIDGLWDLKFGNGGLAGDPQTLFFTAGRHNETSGLFGTLRVTSGVVGGKVFLNSQGNGLPGAMITLTGTPTTGPAIPINLTAVTDSGGSFTFSGLPDGQYQLQTGPFANIVGTVNIGSVSASTGVNVVSPFSFNSGASSQQNVVVRGGLDLHFISLEMFLNTSTTTALQVGTTGAGKPANTPIVTAPIASQSLSATTPSQVIDLAGNFGDPMITDSAVTMNITAGGASQTIKLNMLDTTAPRTVANFFDYINSGAFNNSFFHRETTAAKDGIGVLQGGGAIITNGTGPSVITPVLPTVPDEIATSNTKGTLAMANTGAANSASDQFFFNVVDNKGLDSKFTVFAKVADAASQTVLDNLGATPVQDLSSHTATITATGATETGNTVTITTTAAHNFQVGQTAVVSGVANAGYNGSFTILSVTATTFTYTAPTAGLPASGSGSATASTTFARNSPSLLLNEVPLNGGTVPDFPTDSSKYVVINSITTTKRDDFLTYSIASNSNPTLVNATLTNEQLTVSRGTGTGSATIIVQATDRFGADVIQSLTVTVA